MTSFSSFSSCSGERIAPCARRVSMMKVATDAPPDPTVPNPLYLMQWHTAALHRTAQVRLENFRHVPLAGPAWRGVGDSTGLVYCTTVMRQAAASYMRP